MNWIKEYVDLSNENIEDLIQPFYPVNGRGRGYIL